MYGSRQTLESGSDRRQTARTNSWSLFGRSSHPTASGFLFPLACVRVSRSSPVGYVLSVEELAELVGRECQSSRGSWIGAPVAWGELQSIAMPPHNSSGLCSHYSSQFRQ
jgi:hypothetical protein